MLSVSLFLIFHQINLLNIHKKWPCLVFIFYFTLSFSVQSWHKRVVGVYKVFNSNDLTFYSIYLCFNLDLGRGNKHNCAYFKLAVFEISNGFAPWSPNETTEGLTVPPDTQLCFTSQSMQNTEFFPS